MPKDMELEIKLIMDEKSKKKFFTLPMVKKALVAGSEKTLKLISTYYDTRDYKLSNCGMAYRVRKTDNAYEATVKTSGENIGGFSARGEYTVPLTRKQVVIKGFGATFDKKLATLLAEDELHKLFDVKVTRKIYMLQLTPETLVEVAVDEGEIDATSVAAVISEVEMEIKTGKKEDLFNYVAELAEKLPLFIESRSKFKRGIDLLNGEETVLELPEPPVLDVEKNVEKELKKLLVYYAGNVLVEENILAAAKNIDEDMDVLPSWETLTSLWEFVEPLMDKKIGKAFEEELRNGGRELRELAVLNSCKKDWTRLCEAHPELISSADLTPALIKQEKLLHKELLKNVRSGWYTTLCFKLIALLYTATWQGAGFLQLDQYVDYRLKVWREEFAQISPEKASHDRQILRNIWRQVQGFIIVGEYIKTNKLNKKTYKNLERFYKKLNLLLTDAVGKNRLEALCKDTTSKTLCNKVGILQGYRLALQVNTLDKLVKLGKELQ